MSRRETEREEVLAAVRSCDRYFEKIITTIMKVKIFDYEDMYGWVARESGEGSLYLVKRVQLPFYKFVILSQNNKFGTSLKVNNIPISQYCLFQSCHQYYMIKNEVGLIQAIMFSTKKDCVRICQKVDCIIKELSGYSNLNFFRTKGSVLKNGECLETPMKFVTSNYGDKIPGPMEVLRWRYKDVHEHNDQGLVNNFDKSRQININELFTTKNSSVDYNTTPRSPLKRFSTVDMSSSYTSGGTAPTSSKTLDLSYESASVVLTVTELEKYFAQGVSDEDDAMRSHVEEDSDDDDIQLLNPQKLISNSVCNHKEPVLPIVFREQCKETLFHILQNDDKNGRLFLSQLHSTYAGLSGKNKTKLKISYPLLS